MNKRNIRIHIEGTRNGKRFTESKNIGNAGSIAHEFDIYTNKFPQHTKYRTDNLLNDLELNIDKMVGGNIDKHELKEKVECINGKLNQIQQTFNKITSNIQQGGGVSSDMLDELEEIVSKMIVKNNKKNKNIEDGIYDNFNKHINYIKKHRTNMKGGNLVMTGGGNEPKSPGEIPFKPEE